MRTLCFFAFWPRLLGLALAGATTVGLSATAHAQNWSGFYAGLNAGYGWSSDGVNTIGRSLAGVTGSGANADIAQANFSAGAARAATFSSSNDLNGFGGGGQLGYNWRLSGTIVGGFEVDLQWLSDGTSRSATNSTTGPFLATPFGVITDGSVTQTAIVTKSLDYIGTARARLGYLITPTALVFVTGGLAYGDASASTSLSQNAVSGQLGSSTSASGTGGKSGTLFGWTLGGGVEWEFARNWSVKSEYLYYDLGALSYSTGPMTSGNVAAGFPLIRADASSKADFTGHLARVGINFKF